jgi:hypothetical protein
MSRSIGFIEIARLPETERPRERFPRPFSSKWAPHAPPLSARLLAK